MSFLEFFNHFILFLGLHYIADFPLQGSFLAEMKGKYDYLLFAHAVIWAVVIAIGLNYFGLLSEWDFTILFIGHLYIDRWNARKKDKTFALTRDLWIDQAIHMAQIAICILF